MRIIEKKCPNCGASLEFDNNDKSCKCEYCKRSFVIEREGNDRDFYSPNNYILTLKENNTASRVIFLIFFVIASLFIGFCAYMTFTGDFSFGKKEASIYTKVSEISEDELSDVDHESLFIIQRQRGSLKEYHIDNSIKRDTVYVAYNKENNTNLLICVYKVKYEKFLDSEHDYELYVPIIFENINSSEIAFQLTSGYVKAPEYYFNLEHSEYGYGYQDMESVEKEVIEPLKNEYKISKK